MRTLIHLAFAILATTLAGCVAIQKPDLSAFVAAAPRSILVVPAINKTLDVDAPNYLLSTLTIPLAEKGFYVFPVNTVKVVLEQEGYYEGEQVHRQSPEVVAKLFGADAVLYVTINRWDAQYAILAATVTVDFDYRIVFKDGRELWRANQRMQYSPQTNNAGHPLATLLVAVINAAITRAAPNYLPLTQQANNQVFVIGPTAIPNGPYRNSGSASAQPTLGYVATKAIGSTAPLAMTNEVATPSVKLSVAPPGVLAPSVLIASPQSPQVKSAPTAAKTDEVVAPDPSKQGMTGGKDTYQARRLAKDMACHVDPTVVLTDKSAGAETYSVTCTDGKSIIIQCNFGACTSGK